MLTTRITRTEDIPGAQPLDGLRVLIVEDEALVALDLEMTVRGEGGTVVGPYGRLGAAMRAADEATFDLAVLDIMLGREEVYPLARRLKERGVPFLFHSGHGDPGALRAEFPKALFCPKPCAPQVIVDTLGMLAPEEPAAEGA